MSHSGNKHTNRENEFLETISSPQISLNALRKLSYLGIVESCGIRSVCWRLLLNYLPTKRLQWPSILENKRKDYHNFVQEIIIKPGLKRFNAGDDAIIEDHPLNPNPSSEWNTYFTENNVLLQIDKDVRRLCPDISFFQHATDYPCKDLVDEDSKVETLRKRVERSVLSSQSLTKNRSGITNLLSGRKKASIVYDRLEEGKEAHWEVVERILFIYAKLNPGTGYVQGMNEIIGPLYYTLASDPNTDWRCEAEADTFFCFTNLMGEIRDNFLKSLDKSATGIEASMTKVTSLLRKVDSELWLRLEKQNIKSAYYLFRWLTLLLSQEFSLPDVILVWDVLFSDEKRFDLLITMCCAMVILLRDEILSGDFSTNIKLLQNFPVHIAIRTIVNKAYQIQNFNKN